MLIFLLGLNTIFPVVFLIKNCINKKGLLINHIFLFSIGFWYYWIFPILTGSFFPQITITTWSSLYRSIEQKKVLLYLFWTFIIYLAFILAHYIPLKKRTKAASVHSGEPYKAWIVILTFIFMYIIFSNREYLFKGYTLNGKGGRDFIGPLSAMLLTTFSFYAMYSMRREKGDFFKDFKSIYFFCYLAEAIILLGFGGRMYVITTLLILVVIYTNFYKRIKISKGVGYGITAFIAVGVIGVWRLGSEITFDNIAGSVAMESLFTAFPLLYYLMQYKFTAIKFPLPLLSCIIWLVPSAVWPNKADYIIDLPDVGYNIYAPFGALNSFMSFQVNFGMLGTIVVIVLLVIVMRKLNEENGSATLKFIYGSISAHLVFTFFRDPFQVSIIKNIFEFSLLLPVIIALVNSALSNKGRIVRRKRR